MVAQSDEGAAGLVLGKNFFEFRQGGGFRTGGGEIGRRGGGKTGRKGGLDEILKGFEAEEGEHLLLVFFGGAEVARKEGEILGRSRDGGRLGGR